MPVIPHRTSKQVETIYHNAYALNDKTRQLWVLLFVGRNSMYSLLYCAVGHYAYLLPRNQQQHLLSKSQSPAYELQRWYGGTIAEDDGPMSQKMSCSRF